MPEKKKTGEAAAPAKAEKAAEAAPIAEKTAKAKVSSKPKTAKAAAESKAVKAEAAPEKKAGTAKKTVKAAAEKTVEPKAEAKAAAPKAEEKVTAPKAEEKVTATKAEEKPAAPKAEEKPAAPKEKPAHVSAKKGEAKPEPRKGAGKPAGEKGARHAPKPPFERKGHKVRSMTTRMLERYDNEIRKSLMEKYRYRSPMEVPKLEKIVINIGVGEAAQNAKMLEDSVRELTQISGQHPVVTKARKSIANFKLREGQAIGCKVTLRGIRMYEFLDRLVSIALPRVRDFRGVSRNSFDGHGNYTLGVKEQLIFPEIDYDKVSKIRGMDIVIVTTARTDDEAFSLLAALGMPFRR